MKLYIKTKDAIIRRRALSAGIDIGMRQDIVVHPDQINNVVFSLRLRWSEPKAHNFVLLVPRSSTYSRHGVSLANTIGIIDAGFTGDGDNISAQLTADKLQVIPANVYFLQLVPVCTQPYEIEITDEFHSIWQTPMPNRGGFGSSEQLELF